MAEAKVDFRDIGILSFCGVFFTFKVLWAPCMDSYYFKNFGKRKSYIVPTHYMIGLIYFYFSTQFKDLIYNHNIFPIIIFAFLTVFLVAVADVANDGWVLTLLEEHN